jgi:hypothetical protein
MWKLIQWIILVIGKPVTTDTFDEVISPEVADQFTKEKQIDAVQVKPDDVDLVETVHYNDLYALLCNLMALISRRHV